MFTTVTNIFLVCFAKIQFGSTGGVIFDTNETVVIAKPNRNGSTSVPEEVVNVCLCLAALLSFIPSVFAWMMHGDILHFIWTKLSGTEATLEDQVDDSEVVGLTLLHAAQANGSLFWLVSFIFPSLLLMCIGTSVLVWSSRNYPVAVSFTIGLAYCLFQIFRVISNVSAACCGPAKGKGTSRDLEKGNA